MNCTEDQFRSILREEAADVTAESVPPLWLQDREPTRLSRGRAGIGGSRGRRWLVPLGAAAAVTAIAVAATVVAGGGRVPGPDSAAQGLWHGVPKYYLAVPATWVDAPPEVVVVDTRSGVPLAAAHLARDCGAMRASAAADDRTFAVACDLLRKGGPGPTARLYLARFDPAADRLTVIPTRLPLIPADSTIALSPSGTKIAVMSLAYRRTSDPEGQGTETLRVYSVATGTVRTWTAVNVIVGGPGTVSWGPGPLLALTYQPTATNWVSSPELPGSGIRLLNTDAPSGNLVAASKLAVPTTHLPGGYLRLGVGTGGLAVSGNGATVATTLTMKGANQGATEWAEFSLTTGTLLRRWLPSESPSDWVYWSNFSGRILIVQGIFNGKFYVGIMTGDRFRPLPRADGMLADGAAF
jgi:hypothetical protein